MFVITGVTGHVGSSVAKNLLTGKQPVRVVVRDAAKGEPWKKLGAEVVVGSVEDQEFLTETFRGARGLFAMLPPNMSAPNIFEWQGKTSDAIAAAVKGSGVSHVVMLSSIGADLAEGTGPIKGLHYLESALRKTGTTLCVIRAGSFQENVENVMTPAKKAGIYPSFVASQDYPLPMIACRDIGHLAAQMLLEGGKKSEIVDLVGPAYTVRQVAEILGKALGKQLKIVDIPPAGYVDAIMQGGLPRHAAESLAEMYTTMNSGKVAPHGDRMVQGKTTLDEVIKDLV